MIARVVKGVVDYDVNGSWIGSIGVGDYDDFLIHQDA